MSFFKQIDRFFYLLRLGIRINFGIGYFVANNFRGRFKDPGDLVSPGPAAIPVKIRPIG
jgi:hypothetical protein